MIGKLKEMLQAPDGEWVISFTTRENPVKMFYRLNKFEVSVDIKKASGRRSKTANDFCWAMCTDIGNAIRPPIPKEEVYRKAIKAVGRYEMMLMKSDAVDTFQRIWQDRGTGWFSEILDDSKKNPGCKILFLYYGTSVYSSDEMSKVLDYLKDEMEQMELPIPISKAEEERMLKQWGRA